MSSFYSIHRIVFAVHHNLRCSRLRKVIRGKHLSALHQVGRLFSQQNHLSTNRVTLYFNDVYHVELPPTHRFPMDKYKIVRELLQNEFSSNRGVDFTESPLVTSDELKSTHCPEYVDRYVSGRFTEAEIRKTGFPHNKDNIDRALSSAGGTVAAMRTVLSASNSLFAGHIAGGTHHAFYNYGEGFCVFSDIAVACNLALREYPEQVRKIMIIDLDVHQGNGNAVLFKDDPRVFTFSMHCKDNYFSRKEESDIDIELEPGTNDEDYIAKLNIWLPLLFDTVNPQLVFFQAGVDIYEGDRLGKLKISRAGLQRRNEAVYREIAQRKVKCVVTMGGGYPKERDPGSRTFQEIIQCHADVYRACIAHTQQE